MIERSIANYPENLYAHTYKTSMGPTAPEIPQDAPVKEKEDKDLSTTAPEDPREKAQMQKRLQQIEQEIPNLPPLHTLDDHELYQLYMNLSVLQNHALKGNKVPVKLTQYIEQIRTEYQHKMGRNIVSYVANSERDGGSLGAAALSASVMPTHPRLVPIAEEVNNEARRVGTTGNFRESFLENQIKRVQSLIDAGSFATITDRAQAYTLIEEFNTQIEGIRNEHYKAEMQREKSRENTYGFLALNTEDFHALDGGPTQNPEGPLLWLDDSFNAIYRSADQGSELNSPNIESIQRAFADARRYLEMKLRKMPQNTTAEQAAYDKFEKIVKKFEDEQQMRFNLMVNRTMIGAGEIEKVQGSAGFLGAQGLLRGYAGESGDVGAIAQRMGELFDDERLKQEQHHASPEMAFRLQDQLIEEQYLLAQKGIGFFAVLGGDEDVTNLNSLSPEERYRREKKVRARITRTVRTGYDVWVGSQRMGVLVARGRHLEGTDAFFSDPVSSVFNVYNLEDLSINKWNSLNVHQQEFMEEMKNELVDSYLRDQKKKGEKISLSHEEREALGTKLFRDFVAVPDFFSSGWRMKGIVDTIEARLKIRFGDKEGTEKAENLALFMRLKQAGEDHTKRHAAWDKIADYRPEEVVRLFRERVQDGHEAPHALKERLKDLFKKDVFANYSRKGKDASGNVVEVKHGIKNYDEFKEEFGPLINYLRQEGFKKYDQLNIGMMDFNDSNHPEYATYKDAISKFCGLENVSKLQEMYRLMSGFAHISTKELVKEPLFHDIYTRTLLVDDLLLGELEDDTVTDLYGNKVKVVPISKKWGTMQSGDALKRAWNDTSSAIEAAKSLMAFLTKEDKKERWKAAMEFATAVSGYQSADGSAVAIRFTLGTYMNLAKQDLLWDIIGLDKLPLRFRMSRLQKIYGPQAEALGRDALRHELDEIHMWLTKHADEKETPEERAKAHADAEALYHELEKRLEVEWGDTINLRGLRFLFFLILTGVFEGYKVVEAGVGGGGSAGRSGHH